MREEGQVTWGWIVIVIVVGVIVIVVVVTGYMNQDTGSDFTAQ